MGSKTTLVPSISEKVRVLICLPQVTTQDSFFFKNLSLAPSFLCHPTLLLGVPISLPNTMSLTITFTTLIPNATGRTTGGAQYSPVVVSQILAA
jgi:hypothetical protein